MSQGAQEHVQCAEGALPDAKPLVIALQPVKASNIAALGYDAPTKTLEVHFANSGRYRYADVPGDTFTGLLQADSKGSYFAQHVRSKFAGTRIDQKPDNAPSKQERAALRPHSAWPFPSKQQS